MTTTPAHASLPLQDRHLQVPQKNETAIEEMVVHQVDLHAPSSPGGPDCAPRLVIVKAAGWSLFEYPNGCSGYG
jgi:hypothetical protein